MWGRILYENFFRRIYDAKKGKGCITTWIRVLIFESTRLEKTSESYCSTTTKKEKSNFFERVEYKCLMQSSVKGFLEQHLQLFTVVFEQMISSLLLLLRRRTLTSIDRIVKMYPLHVSITIASCHNTSAAVWHQQRWKCVIIQSQ